MDYAMTAPSCGRSIRGLLFELYMLDGADELFARVKKGTVIQIPLAGAQIKNKNDKWNQTTHRDNTL